MFQYFATGIVLGNCWGGGKGAYKANYLKSNDREELMNAITSALKDGSLDGGMGFESLIGAIIEIREAETIEVNGKEYSRVEFFDPIFIGDLSEEEKVFLQSVFDNE